MKYWGYITREELILKFSDVFPNRACPDIESFFAVGADNIVRKIISKEIPVGTLDSEVTNLYSYYDEYLCVSQLGMKWLLPALCKYILMKKRCHEEMASSILFYIEDASSEGSYNLNYLDTKQKEALYNLLEYCSETYDLSVIEAQDFIKEI
ncbi:hypothetical protein V6H34_004974 [Vibrio harveyi]